MERIIPGKGFKAYKNGDRKSVKQVIKEFLSFKQYVLVGNKDHLQHCHTQKKDRMIHEKQLIMPSSSIHLNLLEFGLSCKKASAQRAHCSSTVAPTMPAVSVRRRVLPRATGIY